MKTMTDTDLMFALSVGGLALSTVYCIAEFMQWQTQRAVDQKAARQIRGLYAKLISVESIRRSARGLVSPLAKLTGSDRGDPNKSVREVPSKTKHQ
jgi:hypothetical protein